MIILVVVVVGLFKKKQPEETIPCDICRKHEVKSRTHKASNGVMCSECYSAAGFPASISSTLVPLSLIRTQINSTDGLTITKRFKAVGGKEPESKLQNKTITADSSPVKCPKCGSESISADKKGFGVGKAAVGAVIAGPIGLVAGGIGANQVRITCLKCGNQWIAGE